MKRAGLQLKAAFAMTLSYGLLSAYHLTRNVATQTKTIQATDQPPTDVGLMMKNETKIDKESPGPEQRLLDLFKAKDAPIMGQQRADPKRPVRIRVLLFLNKHGLNIGFRKGPTWAISDEVLNICMDGWKRSPYFEFVNATIVPDFAVEPDFVLQEDEDIVWVADMRRMLRRKRYTITEQLAYAANATLHYQRQRAASDPTYRQPTLKVVYMDWRDRIREPTLCTEGTKQLIDMLGDGNVARVRQQVVQGRRWNQKLSFPVPPRVWDSTREAACFGRPALYVPYTVRSEYAEAVQQSFPFYLPRDNTDSSSLTPVDTTRPVDAAHFWPVSSQPHANLRNAVTEVVLSLNGTAPSGRLLRVIGDYVSESSAPGRVKLSSSYVEALMTAKIVVVAQRDSWEDHYRLFEAFVGGAMVMTDPMVALPDGLVDGENVVVYRSLRHLRELLLYYLNSEHEKERLAIARKGWEIAMSRHRSYHWMEAIFFGTPLSS